jgi:DNA-binding XRE family transcriptional regulator
MFISNESSSRVDGAVETQLQTFSMAKPRDQRPAPRGPYETDDPEKLGTGDIKLRQWRLFRKMTVAMLAEAAELSTGTISGIEGGDLGYSYVTLHKLAKALRTTVAGLFGVNPLKDREFWSVWDQASAPQRQRIMDHALGVVGPRKM